MLSKIVSYTDGVFVLGQFDGIHLGHLKLINEALSFAKKNNKKTYVLSFEGNYKNSVLGKTSRGLILSDEEKIKMLKSIGVDECILLPFDSFFMNMSPDQFIKKVLIEKFNVSALFCGFNYHFGHNGMGDSKSLQEKMKKYNVDVHVLKAVKHNGIEISCSNIKHYIFNGQIKKANKFLGRPFEISGKIIHGNQIGRTIGFKTANIIPETIKILPKNGVYATKTHYNGKIYKSMTNIGFRPTVDGEHRIIETNIFNFNNDIYGKKIRVEFIDYVRTEQKFENILKLKQQLLLDKKRIKEVLSK